ncbi:acetate kinase, partial [Microbacterium sp. NPDC057467]
MSAILVINSGSSSLKYSLIDTAHEDELASGLIERIGQDSSPVAHTVRPEPGDGPSATMLDATYRGELRAHDHAAAFEVMR